MWDYKHYNNKWSKSVNLEPATEKQQKYLEILGWGRDNLTKNGASVIIRSILEA